MERDPCIGRAPAGGIMGTHAVAPPIAQERATGGKQRGVLGDESGLVRGALRISMVGGPTLPGLMDSLLVAALEVDELPLHRIDALCPRLVWGAVGAGSR